MSHAPQLRKLAIVLAGAVWVALTPGCYAEAGVQPAYVEASAAPGDMRLAPQTEYEGRTVYYVNNRWYAHDRGRWVYYRNEPQLLFRHRLSAEHVAQR